MILKQYVITGIAKVFLPLLDLSFLLSSRLLVLSCNSLFFSFIVASWIPRLSSKPIYLYTSSCSRSLITVFRSGSTYVASFNFPLLKVALVHSPSSHDIPVSSLNFCIVCSKLLIDYYRVSQTSWDHSYEIDDLYIFSGFYILFPYPVRFSSFERGIKDRKKVTVIENHLEK